MSESLERNTQTRGTHALRPRLLLADDHGLALEGLSKLLEADFTLVGKVGDGRSLLRMAAELNPDAVLLDISIPLLNGIDAARQLRSWPNPPKLIFVTMHADKNHVQEAFRAGASGYVLKLGAASELTLAIREVLAGRIYISPLIAQIGATSEKPVGKRSRTGAFHALTPRQREVLQLVAEGKTGKEIAGILNVSIKTVEFHKSSIMTTLNLHSTAELTRYALKVGLVGLYQ